MTQILDALRQWRYPGALRIAPSPMTDATGALRELVAWLRRPVDPPPGQTMDAAGLVKAVATWSWRVDKQAGRLDDSGEARTMKGRIRQLAELWREHDVQIYDYTGRPYDPDELWDDVLASEEAKARPVITSMRAPRIVFRGVMIQRGTPIVEDAGAARDTGGHREHTHDR